MPLPEPTAAETDEQFLDRCMANTVMNSEFPSESERYAACLALLTRYDESVTVIGMEKRKI